MLHCRIFTIALACAALSLSGCGGDSYHQPPSVTTQISSDPAFDGDIQQTSASTFTITQGMSPSVQSVLAGIDPSSLTEFRAFLDFPLGGPNGVPAHATIESAALDIFIPRLRPSTTTIPLLIELVSMQPPTLYASDFDRTAQPPLASTQISISPADAGTNVSIDVTSLMVQAQLSKVVDFQVRILEDLGPAIPVLMEINDSTGSDRPQHAPLLTVTYF